VKSIEHGMLASTFKLAAVALMCVGVGSIQKQAEVTVAGIRASPDPLPYARFVGGKAGWVLLSDLSGKQEPGHVAMIERSKTQRAGCRVRDSVFDVGVEICATCLGRAGNPPSPLFRGDLLTPSLAPFTFMQVCGELIGKGEPRLGLPLPDQRGYRVGPCPPCGVADGQECFLADSLCPEQGVISAWQHWRCSRLTLKQCPSLVHWIQGWKGFGNSTEMQMIEAPTDPFLLVQVSGLAIT
jgi:hypothetical protein